jgi:GMP synthase-like glutamine amidotransferase
MTVGERAWSMQGHPEFTPAICDVLYESRRELIGGESVDAAKRTLANDLSNESIAASIVRLIRG